MNVMSRPTEIILAPHHFQRTGCPVLRCELVHSTVECDRGETSTSAGGHKAIGAIRANAVAIDWQEKNSKAAACAESRPTRVSELIPSVQPASAD